MKLIRCCSGLAVGLSVYGCGAAGDLDAPEAENSLGSEKERLLTPLFTRVQASRISPSAGSGRVTVECPSSHPYLLGTAAQAQGTLRQITPGGAIPTDLEVEAVLEDQEKRFTAEAVCSDAKAFLFVNSSSTGQKTVQCPSGMIAVGGGAKCYGSGRLFRSRPSPDDDGSTPSGWAAGCTGGSIDTYAICIEQADTFDFRACRSERKDGTGSVDVQCSAGSTALSAGGYCGSNKPLSSMDLHDRGATVKCADPSANVHAYAVCCG